MPNVRDLRDHIRSLKNTQQITRATRQVAASKIRRAKLLLERSTPYADAFTVMLRDLMASGASVDDPFTKPGRPGAPLGVILVTSDRGLAGALNVNLIRAAKELASRTADIWWYSVGIKGRNALRAEKDPTESFWPLTHGDMGDTAHEICVKAAADFNAGKISAISLISPKLVSVLSQPPQTRALVPILAPDPATPAAPARALVEFSPSKQAVLSRLFPKYLELTIYCAMLETQACFFSAQLIAMNNATENAGKLIDELTAAMNKARQETITTEMLEIVSGAEALRH